jgi:uncharacterized membrane protein YgdD (TMEM256/DUF423 family)
MVAPMDRVAWIVAGVYGFLGVALGAFGAHGLRGVFERSGEAAKRVEWWQTATHYHLVHALAIALCGVLYARGGGTSASVATWSFALGVLLFSGSLYAMALTGVRGLGAVTPLGGLAFLGGWALLAWTSWRG